ncbi:hypothetical protein C8Q76DRAFT_687984 [Earliella scabrosa]|nr:hypothetical protein C8Q76DRAFT_687984 [Earliella scabrosa]
MDIPPAIAIPSSLRDRFIQGLAAILLGTFIVAVYRTIDDIPLRNSLEGVLLQSLFIYFRFYAKDPVYLKIWVVAIVLERISFVRQPPNAHSLAARLIQTACCGMVMHTSFFYLVTNYFNPLIIISGAAIFTGVWESSRSSKVADTIKQSINNLLVQFFFARRALILGYKYRYIVYFAMILNLASCGFWFSLAAQAFEINDLEKSTHFGGWIITTASALMLVGDMGLTGVLIWALNKNRTGIKRTNTMIDVLITYAISTACSTLPPLDCDFTKIAAFPTSTICTAFLYISQQVNSNSVLIALNTRRLIMSVGEVEATETNPFRSRAVLPKHKESDTAVREVALPSMMFAAGPSTTEFELKEVPGIGPRMLRSSDSQRGDGEHVQDVV